MNTLRILEGKIAIDTTITKMRLSLDEIRETNPHRVDLIQSMSESIKDLELSKRVTLDLEENWRVECKSSFRMTQLSVDLRNQVTQLQEEIIDLNREI